MKNIFILSLFVVCFALSAQVQERDFAYAPGFRYCPDRDYDLAWENDRVAFRIYGKQPSADAGLSGVDCWHKRVDYPILDRWYGHLFEKGMSYHNDYGEGCDQYHVANSRGCGGVGIWKNEELLRSGLYESWEIISLTQTTLKFKVVYSWTIEEERIVETRIITLENGSQLYEAESQFTKNSRPIVGLEIGVGLATDYAPAKVSLNPEKGWMSAWHALLREDCGSIGTGVVVEPSDVVAMIEHDPVDENEPGHALVILKTDTNGKIRFASGFAWEKANRIPSSEAWNQYLSQYSF